MSGAVWWSSCSNTGYLGLAPHDGLQWKRHSAECAPGMWLVSVTGWSGMHANAVVDDFGNLVQVRA